MHYAKLYSPNVESIVTIDSVTSFRPMHTVDKTAYSELVFINTAVGKVFPYSLPSVGPGADPGVQAVSPQVT